MTLDSSDLVKLSNGRDKGLRGGDVGVGGVTTDSSDLVKLPLVSLTVTSFIL